MKLLRELKPADYATLTATALIMTSFWWLAKGELEMASAFALVAIFFDFIDGKIARKYGASPHGKYLDSLFDVGGFVIFPTLLLVLVRGGDILSLIVAVLYSVSAILRLARFTDIGLPEGSKHYIGMPVLYSVIAIMMFKINMGIPSTLVLILMTPLMISEVKIHKPSHTIYGLILLSAAIGFLYA